MRIQFSRPTLLAALAIFALATTFTGFGLARRHQQSGSTTPSVYTFSPTPEAAIESFIKEINAGEYGQAARYYWEAPDVWRNTPSLWKSVIEGPTHGNQVERYELRPSDSPKGDAAAISGHIFTKEGRREVHFDSTRRPEGWLITSFR